MKLKTIIIISAVFITTNHHGQNSWQDELEYGTHSIGFKTIHIEDYSRPYIKESDSIYSPRPMQISVWYPMAMNQKNTPITFGYLLSLEETVETLQKISLSDASKPSDKYLEYFKGDKIEHVFNKPMKAIFDATQLKGSFPLILYGSSQSSSGYDNALLCEQLASHGYIVITVASKGAYSRPMPFNEEGAEAQTRDLEFLYGYMHNFPNVDIKNIGTVGFSFGGLNMVTFSLKNKNVKAMVSFDGSIPPGYHILQSYNYIDIKEFNSNFLGFLGGKSYLNNYPLFDDASLSDIYLLKLNKLDHLDFSSFNITILEKPNYVYKAYTDMANLTVQFLNQNFKKGNTFDESIKNYSKEIYADLRQKKSNTYPKVLKAIFINYINKYGIDKGIEVYYETKKDFPEYRLFDYKAFRDVGYLKMMEEDYDNAIKLYRILLDAYPNTPDSYRRLGEAYMENGDYKSARELLTKGLEMTKDDNKRTFKAILKILDERDKNNKN